MNNYARENRPWLIWLTIIAVILACVGVFFYYTLLRQSKSELIEAIPTDATFIFVINDNDAFVRDTKSVTPYLNELFLLDALPAYETMRGKLPSGEYDLTVSGHTENDAISILFNMHSDKAAFKRLLRALSIDPNNYTAFENNRIYTYGTNFKSVKFVYTNHIISFSTDVELLKRAIVQHAHPKNLLSDKQFKEMYNLTEKNRKQNWLIVNPERYSPYFSTFLKDDLAKKMSKCLTEAGWTALQLRFSGNEMFMSGYMFSADTSGKGFCRYLKTEKGGGSDMSELLPYTVNWYADLKNGSDLWDYAMEYRMAHVDEGVAAAMRDLSPTEICCFSLSADSIDYRYYLVLPDTSHDFLSALYADMHMADSIRNAHPNGIYPVINKIAHLMPNLAPDTMNWVFANGRSIVFAPSAEAVTVFQKIVKSKGALNQNRYYPFVNEAIASSSVYRYVLFNNETLPFLSSQLSDKGNASRFGKELRIFSLSCETMEKDNNLLPVNLYLLF